MTSFTIDKMFEIFGPIFEQNERFVNGKWSHYKFQKISFMQVDREILIWFMLTKQSKES